MTWATEDGRHEGALLPEFGDGQLGLGITVKGTPRGQIVVGLDGAAEMTQGARDLRITLRQAAEVIGWRVLCRCDRHSRTTTWQAPRLLERVPSRHLEDVLGGTVHAADGDVSEVPFREDVSSVAEAMWRQHADAATTLDRIGELSEEIRQMGERLDEAVSRARAHGVPWDAIGRAAGIRRQSAHARWRGLEHPR